MRVERSSKLHLASSQNTIGQGEPGLRSRMVLMLFALGELKRKVNIYFLLIPDRQRKINPDIS